MIRRLESSLFAAALIVVATSTALQAAENVVVDGANRSLTDRLLDAMPAEESDRRREAVSDTLAKFPGATETLLLSLFIEEYQDELWKRSATTAGPVDRGDGT